MLGRPALSCIYPAEADWSSSRRRTVNLVNAVTEDTYASFPIADGNDVELAVSKAKECFQSIRSGTVRLDRRALLDRLMHQIEANSDEFAAAISDEMGAPIDFSRKNQVQSAIGHLRAIRAAAEISTIDYNSTDTNHFVTYEAIGVAALITPWNWPLNQIALKAGAAIAAGCTMVWKPSELAIPSAMLFARCLTQAGAPDGFFNVVLGDGTIGSMLASHPDLDIISFTGSTDTGKKISADAGFCLTPVLMELGGKSANILFDSCDLEVSVRQGVAHCFRNSGQSCNAASRMLVHSSIYDRAVQLVVAEANGYRCDVSSKPGPHLGPLVSAKQFKNVQSFILSGMAEGATLSAGGLGRFGEFSKGFFARPTVFSDVTASMSLFQEEVFGPVLSMTPFETEEEAIRLANDTSYGLAAFVQTADLEQSKRISSRLDCGMVQVNGASRLPGTPFGGVKNSGYGREAGLFGIRAFQYAKSFSASGG